MSLVLGQIWCIAWSFNTRSVCTKRHTGTVCCASKYPPAPIPRACKDHRVIRAEGDAGDRQDMTNQDVPDQFPSRGRDDADDGVFGRGCTTARCNQVTCMRSG